MCKRPKRFIVTVKILDIIRPYDFHGGDLLHGWIASAEGGVNGCIWLKLVEWYFCYSSSINTHLHFMFIGNASSPACGRVARMLAEASWADVVWTGHFWFEEGDSCGGVPTKCLEM